MSNRDTSKWGVSRRTYLRGIGLAGLAAVSSESALAQVTDSDVVSVGNGNYATVQPEGVYDTPGESYLFDTDNVGAPYPTNGWWQRELFGVANTDDIEPYADGFGVINAVPSMAVSKEDGDGFRTFYAKDWGDTPADNGNVRVDYGGSPGLDVGHAATDEFDGSYVDGYGDWHVRVEYGSGTPNLTATFVKGSAFTFCEYEGGEAVLGLVDADDATVDTDSASVFYDDGNVIGVSVTANDQQKDYGIFAPEGVTFDGVDGGSLTSNPVTTSGLIDNDGYLSIAPLPDTTNSTIEEFAKYAYNFVTDTTVDWEYVQSESGSPASEVRTTFDFTLDQKAESANGETLSWLFPHQHKYTDASLQDVQLFSAKGTLELWAGSSFQTSKTYRGILPMMPGSVLDSEAQSNVTSYVDQLIDETVPGDSGSGPYTSQGVPAATYWTSKDLFRNTVAAPVAESHATDSKDTSVFVDAVRARLEAWFDATDTSFDFRGKTYDTTNESGSDRELFFYNTTLGTLLGYPSGEFFLSRQMNDHHFHYGYFVYAASEVARQYPTFADEFGDMVELLIRDYANWERPANDGDPSTAPTSVGAQTPKDSPKDAFPFLRNFDAYAGHSWAGGFASFNGNNQEASSEAVNAYAAMIRWGEITGNDAIRDTGIFLYTQEVHAVWEYWYDNADNSQPDDWGENVTNQSYAATGDTLEYATKVRGIGFDRDLFFAHDDPIALYGINWIPMAGHSFYHGRDRNYANANWQSLLDARGSSLYDIADEERDFQAGWKAAAWGYRAMSNPEDAVEIADAAMSDGPALKDGGNSGPLGYQFVHALDAMGTPDDVTADTPFYQTFSGDTERTYVAYNASDAEITVNFSDGYSMTVAANAIAAESSSANFTPDTTAPSAPDNLTVETKTYNTVDISWDSVTDSESGLFYYGVYVDGTKVAEVADPERTIDDLSPGTEYTIAVSAVDRDENESSKASVTTSTKSADTAVPSAPSAPFAIEWDADSVEFAWTEVDAPDFGVDHYNIYADGNKQAEASSPPTTITGLSGDSVDLQVSVVNGAPASNESELTETITVTLNDPGENEPFFSEAQPLPGRLELEYYDRGGPNVAYRDTTEGQGQYAGAFRTDQSVGMGSDAPDGYNLAYTAQYEWIEYTVDVESAGTYDIYGSYANGSGSTGGPIQIEVDGTPQGDAFTVPATGAYTTFEQSSLGTVDLPEGEHVVRLFLEGGGFNLDWLEFRSDGGDTAEPSAPSNVTASTAEDSVELSWDAASDDESSVFLYNVYRDGSPVETVASTSATVDGLTGGTEYSFAVSAQDAFGNESSQATITTTTDLPGTDETPPSAPSNVRAINTTRTSVDVGWDAATDNVGVDHYTVSVDGEAVGQTDQTWFTVDSLEATTSYDISVTASDAAGNEGPAASATLVTADQTGQAPFEGVVEVPGVVRAEEFDHGGQGVSYVDTTPGNEVNITQNGGIEFRNDTDVDIGALDGDYNVGYIGPGEWMEYTIDVPATGYYDIGYRVAAGGGGGGAFHIEIDGVDVTGSVSVAQTGGWTNYVARGPVTKVPLTAGTHVMRFQLDSGAFNVDQFDISPTLGPAIDRSSWAVTPTAAYHDADGGRAIDDDPSTEWASQIQFQETAIQYAVDMGEPHRLGSVVVEHTGAPQAPATMDVQVSDDGSEWTTVATVDGAVTTTAEFAPVTTRYFRLVDRDESSTNWWKITNIEAFEAATGLASDTSAPTAPSGLTVDSTTATQAQLSWDAVGSDDLHHYTVTVDGQQYRQVGTNSAVVADLSTGESYEIAVSAVDDAGNESSAATTTVQVTAAVEYTLTTTESSGETLRIDFEPESSVAAATLRATVDGTERAVDMIATENGWYTVIDGLSSGTTVQYRVEYERGGQSTRTDRQSHDFTGGQSTGIVDLDVDDRTPTTVSLSWELAADTTATQFYVMEGDKQVATVSADQTSTQLTGLTPATDHTFVVRADVDGDSSQIASPVRTVTTDPYGTSQREQIARAWFTDGSVGNVPLAGRSLDYGLVRRSAANRGGEDE